MEFDLETKPLLEQKHFQKHHKDLEWSILIRIQSIWNGKILETQKDILSMSNQARDLSTLKRGGLESGRS